MKYWLMKSEPDVYSFEMLEKEGVTQWEGVRNYQARNMMRDEMKIGDQVLFYHSNTKPPGIPGIATVCRESYPDFFAWKDNSKYFDPKSTPENPRWMMVDVKYKKKFKTYISLDDLKTYPELDGIMVTKRGCRLSVQPVSKDHYDFIVQLGMS